MALMGLSSNVTAMMRSSSNKRACSGSNAGVVTLAGVLLVLVLLLLLLLCLRNRLMLAMDGTVVDLAVLLLRLLLVLLRLGNAKAARVALEATTGRSAKPWHVRTKSKERVMVARRARVQSTKWTPGRGRTVIQSLR